MVFAVLLMSAGVFILAAVLQLAATQGVSGDTEWGAMQRRVTLLNSRAMAREHLLTRLFRVPQDTNTWPATFSNAWGGFTNRPLDPPSANYWTELSTTNTNVVINVNPFNLMERGGFYRENFLADLLDGNTNTSDGSTKWSFALRMRSPVGAGYQFVQQRPAAMPSGYASSNYIDMNGTGEQFFAFYGLPRMPVSSVTNTMTRGTGDANGYEGYLDVPAGQAVLGNFANETVAVWKANLDGSPSEVEVLLDLVTTNASRGQGLRYEVPERRDFPPSSGTNFVVGRVVLVGANSEFDFQDPRPVHVVLNSSNTTCTELVLSNNNNTRRVYFYRAKAANDGTSFTVRGMNASQWRLGITMMQCDVVFATPNLTITGGLRTDGEVRPGTNPVFVPETDPRGLDFIADRMMWLEDYRATTW